MPKTQHPLWIDARFATCFALRLRLAMTVVRDSEIVGDKIMSIKIAIPKERKTGELRVAMTPSLVDKLMKLGTTVGVEKGAALGIDLEDDAYKNTEIFDQTALYQGSQIIIKVQPPMEHELVLMSEGAILISFLYPYLNSKVVKQLTQKHITSFAMELIPRISRAQDMDALSSQATIAGYKATLIAANHSKFFFPMLTTAAGSIRPAKVFIIGAGVAGLQAIATARRLGAQVSAYDVRPDTREQVESLGAKFFVTGIQAVGAGGYARELSDDEKRQQEEMLKRHLATCDVVITTAGIPGKAAPKVLSVDMVASMRSGSVIVDMLADMGGNCELTKAGAVVQHNGVSIIGPLDIPSGLALHASEMYARNIINLLKLIIRDGVVVLDWTDEIIAGAVVTHGGEIRNPGVRKLLENGCG